MASGGTRLADFDFEFNLIKPLNPPDSPGSRVTSLAFSFAMAFGYQLQHELPVLILIFTSRHLNRDSPRLAPPLPTPLAHRKMPRPCSSNRQRLPTLIQIDSPWPHNTETMLIKLDARPIIARSIGGG